MALKDLLGKKWHDGMTVEEIENGISELDLIEKSNVEGMVDKKILDRTMSELSKVKKDLKAKLSTEEAEKLTEIEKHKELQEKYEQLLKKDKINTLTSEFLGLGYDKTVSEKISNAMIENDFKSVLGAIKEREQVIEKSIRKKILEETPRPDTDDNTGEKNTSKKIKDMSLDEIQELAEKDKEQFDEIMKGN